MRNELQHIERIDQYLNNELSATDTIAFEQELQNNSTLQTQLETQKLLKQAALRKAIKADIAKYGGSGSMGFNWSKWLGVTGIIALIIGALWLGKDVFSTTENNNEQNQLVTTQKDSTKVDIDTLVTVPTDSISQDDTTLASNSNSSKKPKSKEITYSEDTYCGGLKTWVKPDIQTHTIDPSKGATIEGKEGSLVIVPSNAFVDNNGTIIKENVKLEIVEALKVSDMLAYNLTTMNGDKPLQTGGMLYIQPYVNGEKVNINPDRPLYVEIPTDEYNPDMLAWNGKIDENGNIDWQNPQPLKRYLTKVDFDNLDFLPNGFADAVEAGMPFKSYKKADKKLVDSLYYSIGDYQTTTSKSNLGFNTNNLAASKIFPNDSSINKIRYLRGNIILEGLVVNEQGQPAENAQVNIIQNGRLNKKPIATNKKGEFIFDKLETGTFVVVANGLNNTGVTSTPYSSNDVDSIKIVKPLILVSRDNLNRDLVSVKTTENNPSGDNSGINNKNSCFIAPQSIQTIKSEAFANTFLATKEFEQRLKVLHQMPNAQELFDLYVNNLSKDLHEVDAIVAAKLNGVDKKYFTDFANEKLTNVENSNIYQDQLSAYYNKKKKEYSELQQEAQEAYSKKSRAELVAYQNKLMNLTTEYNRLNNSILTTNTSSAKKVNRNWPSISLNLPLPVKNKSLSTVNVATAPRVYATAWYSGGWMNIDAYLNLISVDPVEVDITMDNKVDRKGAKVYQFLNTLKTIIPLAVIGTIYKAKFPKAGSAGSGSMKNTFAIGIQREKGKIFFAQNNYNPYSSKTISLEWEEVTEDELMKNLQAFDGTTPLINEIKQQQEFIKRQLKIESQKTELKVEMDSIQSKIAIIEKVLALERVFIETLEKVVNSCGVALRSAALMKTDNSSKPTNIVVKGAP